jgi:NADP-dependent 3-hydroxy acid dehydrogenase YdfG
MDHVTRNLLIVGAGPGFSQATARRFGAKGYAIHLIGRTASRLDDLRDAFEADGITVRTYVADVTEHSALTRLLRDIDEVTPIDACIFQPGGKTGQIVDVLDATVANARANVELLTLGSLAVGEALVPRMVARNSGTLVFVGGGSARTPLRYFGNLGMAMAGLRTYALTLNAALKETDVHAAFFTVAGMIAEGPVGPDQLDPVVLADRMWSLVTEHDAREVIMTPDGEIVPKAAR